ncbi:MAG TPA: CaiB/BaiF CoA-transferase family protein [Candidatus Binataceae bacterium]|nr:CaiB/BaiF CoA-transferase family protein [Candidatus Binataceae bacterium]
MNQSIQPLSGVRVIEAGSFITAPFAAMLLADLGAETIKIERPGSGDPFRSFKGGLYSPHFRAHNRNKRSVSLDITHAAGKAVLMRLIDRADVLIENFRPGWMEHAGLGYEAVSKLNPRLIYCSINGFGSSGPYRDRPSYDTVGQALSGFLSLSVDADNSQLTGTAASDAVTGMYACYGILGALVMREKTGRGTRVETTMLNATMAFIETWFVEYFLTGVAPGIRHKSRVNQSFAMRCADGKLIALHLSSPPKFWDSLLAAIEAPQLAADERFNSRVARIDHYEELRQELAAIFARLPRSDWTARLERHDVPFAPIYSLDEVSDDPQVRFMELFRDLVHPTEGATRMVRRPVAYSESRDYPAIAPPALGEHTEAILAELGYSPAEIERIRADKVI